ncbi:hypothetical protein V6N13_065131 [Hibiscus sabdariffa]
MRVVSSREMVKEGMIGYRFVVIDEHEHGNEDEPHLELENMVPRHRESDMVNRRKGVVDTKIMHRAIPHVQLNAAYLESNLGRKSKSAKARSMEPGGNPNVIFHGFQDFRQLGVKGAWHETSALGQPAGIDHSLVEMINVVIHDGLVVELVQ